MTLAVFDGHSIVADKSVFKHGFVTGKDNKIRALVYDRFVAYFTGSGSITDIDIVYESLKDAKFINMLGSSYHSESIKVPKLNANDLYDTVDCMLVVVARKQYDINTGSFTDDRKPHVYQIGNSGRALPVDIPYAIGEAQSQLAARAALMAGADALKALKVACDLTLISHVDLDDDSTYSIISI